MINHVNHRTCSLSLTSNINDQMCRLNPLGHPDLAYCSAAGQLPFSITISNINKAFCNFLLSHDLAKCKQQKFQPAARLRELYSINKTSGTLNNPNTISTI